VISYEHGRWRSSRTNTEKLNAALEAVRQLTDEERAALGLVLGEFEGTGHSETADEAAEFEWEETPLPIDEWLQSEYHIGETGKDLYPILREDMCELFHAGALKKGGYAEAVLCLHPDTRVPLLDGTAPTIAELAERWQRDSVPFWVYSYVNGELGRAQAVQPRQTGVDDYYQVTLDDGSTFIGNSRHQMLRRTGEKVMIRDMRPGDSLMPFEVKLSAKDEGDRIEGYEKLQLLSGEWVYTHRLVAAGVAKEDGDEDTIHHDDFNKRNNAPGNLRWMRWREHIALHALLYAEWRAANPGAAAEKDAAHAEHLASLWEGEEGATRRIEHAERLRRMNLEGLASEAGKLAWTNRSEVAKRAFSAMMAARNTDLAAERRTDITLDRVRRCGATNLRQAAVLLECSASRVRKVIEDAGLTTRDVFGPSYGRGRQNCVSADRPVGPKPKLSLADIERAIAAGANTTRAAAAKLGVNKKTIYNTLKRHGKVWADLCELVGNHYVVKVEKVGRGPVYCLSVPGAGNFAISTEGGAEATRSGVFSSNTGAIGWG